MLRKFRIFIEGQEYLVEMEEIGGPDTQNVAAPIPATGTIPTGPSSEENVPVIERPTAAPNSRAETGGEAVEAPMPGTILKILVEVGQVVTQNQPLMILEAMKMENEIVASRAGTILSLAVQSGTSVNAGDLLLTLGN